MLGVAGSCRVAEIPAVSRLLWVCKQAFKNADVQTPDVLQRFGDRLRAFGPDIVFNRTESKVSPPNSAGNDTFGDDW